MKPMLARTYGPQFRRFPCYLQPKLNGVRALCKQGFFQSRDEKVWSPIVISHLTEVLRDLPRDIIFDGELYVHGWKLQRINGAIAVNRKTQIADTLKVEYHIFDVVHPKASFKERFVDQGFASQNPLVHFVPTHHIWLEEEIKFHFDQYVADGYEGVMLRPDGPYEPEKRSQYLWKYKSWEDAEFLCVGITTGKGKAAIGIGALTLEHNGKNFQVGTGFDDETRETLFYSPPIGQKIRVRFPYTSADGTPQCPSFVAVMPPGM